MANVLRRSAVTASHERSLHNVGVKLQMFQNKMLRKILGHIKHIEHIT